MRAILLACGILVTAAQAVEARTPRFAVIDCDMRGCRPVGPEVQQPKQHHRQAKRQRDRGHKISPVVSRDAGVKARTVGIVEHPQGCPRTAFCGCGVAVKVFGKPIRDLWLAANWFRFKSAQAAAGMVAVRRHHVFFILEVVGRDKVLAYDPNSGHHQTRIHLRSLAGYRVVDPRSG